MAASKLPRDPLQPPPARPQPQHLRHVVRRLHHLPPWIFPRRGFRDSLLVHSLSPQLAKEGAIPRGAEGAVFHAARHRNKAIARARAEGASLQAIGTAVGLSRERVRQIVASTTSSA